MNYIGWVVSLKSASGEVLDSITLADSGPAADQKLIDACNDSYALGNVAAYFARPCELGTGRPCLAPGMTIEISAGPSLK